MTEASTWIAHRDFQNFELASRSALTRDFPAHAPIISRLTRKH